MKEKEIALTVIEAAQPKQETDDVSFMMPASKFATAKVKSRNISSAGYLAIAVVGSLLLAIPIYLEASGARNLEPYFDTSATVWSIFFIIAFSTFFLFGVAQKLVHRVLDKYTHIKKHEKIRFLKYIKVPSWLFLWSIVLIVSWDLLFNKPCDVLPPLTPSAQCNLFPMRRIILVFLSLSVGLLIEKTIVGLISISYHRSAYKARIDENNFGFDIIETIKRASKRNRMKASPSDEIETNMIDTSDDSFSGKTKRDLFRSFHLQDIVSIRKVTGLLRGKYGEKFDRDTQLREASEMAEKLFAFLARNEERDLLFIEDFALYFHQPNEAEKVFAMFDIDFSGEVTRKEFRSVIKDIYREKINLSRSLLDMDDALGKLDIVFIVVLVVILLFISLKIHNIDIQQYITLSFSFLLALNVFAGTSFKNILEAIVFLFSTHPYDVGEQIVIDDNILTVNRMHLLTTIFKTYDGHIIYYPNSVLAIKPIMNRDRSIETYQTYEIDLGKEHTTVENVKKFKTAISAYVSEREKRFDQKFSFDPLPIKHLDSIRYQLKVQLKKSRDKKSMWHTQNEFSIFIRDLVHQFKSTNK